MGVPEVTAPSLLPPEKKTWALVGNKVGRHNTGGDLALTSSAISYSGKQRAELRIQGAAHLFWALGDSDKFHFPSSSLVT